MLVKPTMNCDVEWMRGKPQSQPELSDGQQSQSMRSCRPKLFCDATRIAQVIRKFLTSATTTTAREGNSRDAAIDAEILAGHPAGRVGSQKSDHVGNLRRLAQPAERRQLRKPLELFRRFAGGEQFSLGRSR